MISTRVPQTDELYVGNEAEGRGNYYFLKSEGQAHWFADLSLDMPHLNPQVHCSTAQEGSSGGRLLSNKLPDLL